MRSLIQISGAIPIIILVLDQAVLLPMMISVILNVSFWIPEEILPRVVKSIPLASRCLIYTSLSYLISIAYALGQESENLQVVMTAPLIASHLLFAVQSPYFISWKRSPLAIFAACTFISWILTLHYMGTSRDSLLTCITNAVLLVATAVFGLTQRKAMVECIAETLADKEQINTLQSMIEKVPTAILVRSGNRVMMNNKAFRQHFAPSEES